MQVTDVFAMFILYRSSSLPPEQYDPNNLWTPILFVMEWGWNATANEDLGNFELGAANYFEITTDIPPYPPVWTGSIPDNILQNNNDLAERRARVKRHKGQPAISPR